MKTPDESTHYQAFFCSLQYATAPVQFTVNQGGKGEEKQTVHITLHGAPRPEDFPGGDNWTDDEGEYCVNPFYMDWLKYQKDHNIASGRRAGETEFTVHWKKIAERGPVTRKAETVAKEIEKKMQDDPAAMMSAMAQRLAQRKGIPYADALEQIKETWA